MAIGLGSASSWVTDVLLLAVGDLTRREDGGVVKGLGSGPARDGSPTNASEPVIRDKLSSSTGRL